MAAQSLGRNGDTPSRECPKCSVFPHCSQIPDPLFLMVSVCAGGPAVTWAPFCTPPCPHGLCFPTSLVLPSPALLTLSLWAHVWQCHLLGSAGTVTSVLPLAVPPYKVENSN